MVFSNLLLILLWELRFLSRPCCELGAVCVVNFDLRRRIDWWWVLVLGLGRGLNQLLFYGGKPALRNQCSSRSVFLFFNFFWGGWVVWRGFRVSSCFCFSIIFVWFCLSSPRILVSDWCMWRYFRFVRRFDVEWKTYLGI